MGTTVKNETNETATNTPPSWAQPGLEELGRRITSIIPTVPGEQYTGDFLAPPSGLEGEMPGRYLDTADFMRSMSLPAMGAVDASMMAPTFNMAGGPNVRSFGQYDPTGVQSVIEAAMQPAFRQLTEQVLPGMASSGLASGSYGGTRNAATVPGQAIRDTMGEVSRMATQIGYQDFSDFENRNLQAYGLDTERGLGTANTLTQRLSQFPELMNTVLRLQTGATDTEASAAAYDRTLRQNEIDNQLAQFDYGVRYPYQGLDVAAALLGQIANPWGTRTSTGTSTQSSGGLGQLLQGAMGLGATALGMPGGISSIFASKPSPSPGGGAGWFGAGG